MSPNPSSQYSYRFNPTASGGNGYFGSAALGYSIAANNSEGRA